MNTFDQCWLELAALGICDAAGGVQYQRLRTWWESGGSYNACMEWIELNANVSPHPTPKTTSLDSPGSTNADPCG